MTRFARLLLVVLGAALFTLLLFGVTRVIRRPSPGAAGPREASAERDRPRLSPAWPPGEGSPPAVEVGTVLAPDAGTPAETLAVVQGKLVDDQTGQPIAGARLVFRQQAPQAGLRAAVTSAATSDAGGAFTLSQVPSGGYRRLTVDKPGYLPDVIDIRLPGQVTSFDVGSIRLVQGDWRRKIGGGPRGLVGLDHELRDGRVFITAVRPGTPAAQAGLQAGEQIVSVDGKSMDHLPHAARTYHLQGKAGTSVTIVVEAAGGARRTVVLQRQHVPGLPDVPTFY
jgi:membrane-associated protease RseP (regulator of RpoE activity)